MNKDSLLLLVILFILIIFTAVVSVSSIYIYKKYFIEENFSFDQEEEEYKELSFGEEKRSFSYEVIQGDAELCVYIDDPNDDEDDDNRYCYIYKYPKKTLHLI